MNTLATFSKLQLFVLFVLFLLSSRTDGQEREWTNENGKTITAEFIGYDSASNKVTLKMNEKEYLFSINVLSESDQDWIRAQQEKLHQSQNKETALTPESQTDGDDVEAEDVVDREPRNEREEFEVQINNSKNATVIYHDTGSETIVVLVPGANQDRFVGENYVGFTPQFIEEGYSTATVYTDFGPMIDHGKTKNNRYFHRILDAIADRYGDKKFILFGGSNGGMTIMQAVEKNRSKSDILAVIANPTIYVPKKGIDGLPVYLRIGDYDQLGWEQHFDRVSQGLIDRGADLNAKLIPNELHIPMLNHREVFVWLEEHGISPDSTNHESVDD